MTNFSEINFGFSSAEAESENAPELLLEGFFDYDGTIDEVINGSQFLILGYKGSGKSAIAEHIRLSAESKHDLFASTRTLSEFPYSSFAKIIQDDIEPEVRYPAAWSWLLIINLFYSISQDEGAESSIPGSFSDTMHFLEVSGLIPVDSVEGFKRLARTSSKRSFKIQIPPFLQGQVENTFDKREFGFYQLVEYSKDLIKSVKSDSRHILVIDGLDDILTSEAIMYESLAALFLATSKLNSFFRRYGVNAKIVLLCRTDLFERIPGANKNKIRQDYAIQLDWYHNPREPEKSKLIQLADIRARLKDPNIRDIINKYFPEEMSEGNKTARFLIELTRHTPRDFLRLLTYIQEFSESGTLSRGRILNGIRKYSIDYLLPEIKDELDGYISTENIDYLIHAISSLHRKEFSISDLREAIAIYKVNDDVILRGVRALFECSAIGNSNKSTIGSVRYTFKFRNRNSAPNLNDDFVLHKGLWKSLNLDLR